ncbi:MAG: SpoIID/LytB domain-containing protein [Candidatus Riflebacteria bacterium]|nr:SpoIID/LytB domain-containing protein [Candidatus Riflebacteria bacterium]
MNLFHHFTAFGEPFPDQIRIGLLSFGLPSRFLMFPSDEKMEIFDPLSSEAIFSGKARIVEAISIGGELLIKINGKNRFKSNHTLLFSPVGKPPRYMWLVNNQNTRKAYRGSVAIIPGKGRLLGINIIGIRDYLRSVVPSEIGDQAPKTALEAQAIAARTYIWRHLGKHGASGFDLCDGVHCQDYEGVKKEFHEGNLAVAETDGSYLEFEGKPAETVYHAHCGGTLFSSQHVWGGKDLPYLRNHEDRAPNGPFFCSWKMAKNGKIVFEKNSEILNINSEKENKTDEDYSDPNNSMSIIKKLLYDSEEAPNLFEKIKTKSRGHRVGMCQDGAIGMANLGHSTEEILDFYYPGTKLIKSQILLKPEPGQIRIKFSKNPSSITAPEAQILSKKPLTLQQKENKSEKPIRAYQLLKPGKSTNSEKMDSSKNDTQSKLKKLDSNKGSEKSLKKKSVKHFSSQETKPDFRKWFWSPISPKLETKILKSGKIIEKKVKKNTKKQKKFTRKSH